MLREITQQPTDMRTQRILNVVDLTNANCYESLRVGNVIASSEGSVVKYGDDKNGQQFVGFLHKTRKLRAFIVESPEIKGGVLDLRESRFRFYDRMENSQKSDLIEKLRIAGIEQK